MSNAATTAVSQSRSSGPDQLVPPFELPGPRVERDDRVREEVRTGPRLVVEVRPRVADRNQQQSGLRIEAVARPRPATAVLDAGGLLPRLGAGFARPRNRVPAPDLGPVGRTKRHHFAANAEIAPGLAYIDGVVPDQWRGRRVFASGRVHHLAIPQQRAGLCIERDQVAIGRTANQASGGDRRTFVVVLAHELAGPVLVGPARAAIRRVDRVRAEAGRDVEHALVHERRALKRALFAQLVGAHLADAVDVLRVDLVELRIPVPQVALVRREPRFRIEIRVVEFRLRGPLRRRVRGRTGCGAGRRFLCEGQGAKRNAACRRDACRERAPTDATGRADRGCFRVVHGVRATSSCHRVPPVGAASPGGGNSLDGRTDRTFAGARTPLLEMCATLKLIPRPVKVVRAIPFADDRESAPMTPMRRIAGRKYSCTARVLERFATEFLSEASPVSSRGASILPTRAFPAIARRGIPVAHRIALTTRMIEA